MCREGVRGFERAIKNRARCPVFLWCFGASGARQGDAGLSLVFARTVFVGDGAGLVGLEKQHLRDAFVRVDFCRQRRGVGEFEGNVAFPFGF